MADLVQRLRAQIPFTRNPGKVRDGGAAFLSFLQYAIGETGGAQALRSQYCAATGNFPAETGQAATTEETAQYIDWLIETHWGEQPVKKGS